MRRLIRIGSLLFTLILLAVSVPSVIRPVSVAHATAAPIILPNPPWWVDNIAVFSQYDAYQYNHGRTHNGTFYAGHGSDSYILSPGAIFQGVAAIGPRPIGDNADDVSVFYTPDANAFQGYEWECTELVKRYLFLKYGARAIAGNGYEIVDNYAGYNPNVTGYPNLFAKVLNNGYFHVEPGDVLSYGGAENHTAIVSDTSSLDANGDGQIIVLEQNASSTGWHAQDVQSWVIKNGIDNGTANGDTVTAWLHGPPVGSWSNSSLGTGGTTTDWITSLAAPSTSSVWAAGYENYPGYGKRPATFHYDGTSWSKLMPWELVGTYANHWLYGITVSSSGDTFAVGEAISGSTHPTLAYHWVGYWKKVTSASPAPSGYGNTLRSVAAAGSNIFAAGVYWQNASTKLPLLEKWNGSSAFTQQTLSLPSGDTFGELYSVSFNSSTNGWAVGTGGTSTNASYLVYHYDGSSWTPTRGSITNGLLRSVVAISDNEAWAVGSQGSTNATPLVLHYTSGGGWQEDNTAYQDWGLSSASFNSVAADGSGNVWIAGTFGSIPFTLHNFGYGWTRVYGPTGFSSINLQAIAAVTGTHEAWTGGYYGGSPNPIMFHYTTP